MKGCWVSGSQKTLSLSLAPFLPNCASLAKLFNLSEPQPPPHLFGKGTRSEASELPFGAMWFFLIMTPADAVLRPWEGCVGLCFLALSGSEPGTMLRVVVVVYMLHCI